MATTTALMSTPQRMGSSALIPPKSAADISFQSAKSTQSLLNLPARPPPAPTPPTSHINTPPPSPGTFRHPRLTEIITRQSRSTFTDRNVKRAGINLAALVASFILSGPLHTVFNTIFATVGVAGADQIGPTIVLLARVLLIANTILALRPIIPYLSKKDEISDIPLTPSQRALLGLNPSVQPTPASVASSGFITPPRYHRNSGSFSNSPNTDRQTTDRRSISANYSSSPLSTSRYTLGFSPSPTPSQAVRRTASGSPFSPSGSPLFHKAVAQSSQSDLEFNTSLRSSFGASTSSSVLGLTRSLSARESGPHHQRRESEPGTPTPGKSKRASAGINYKWLYDKGSRMSSSGEDVSFTPRI